VTGDRLLDESAEELFEDAPCGYLITRTDGTIVRVNRTFEQWTGLRRENLIDQRRLQDLLTAGGRIYHETHYAPLLKMQGRVREIAVDLVRADGTKLPALINSVLRSSQAGELVRTTVFDATDRRGYERELLDARRREQAIALDLQRSLLSGEPPAGEDIDVGVAYRPAVRGLEVGGDWYDAFWLEEGRSAALVVGDIVGRGLEAAATMGQLRSAVRALASTGLSPGGTLVALDRYARLHQVGQMTTLAYADVDLQTRTLRYACAGHPPPVLLEPGRPAAFAWDGRSLPLDAFAVGGPRAEATVDLAPGSSVVLYTDGLIERSDRTIQSGLDGLLAVVEPLRGRPPAELARALASELAAPRPDDVCVLVARVG
jgi:PAS domain S-box-containing protein